MAPCWGRCPCLRKRRDNEYRNVRQTGKGSSVCFNQLTTDVLVGAIGTVAFTVAEEATLDTRTLTTSQTAVLAEGLLGVELGLDLALLVLDLAVVHRVLPVACLLVYVEVETGRASDRLKSRARALDDVAAIVTFACLQPEPLAGVLVLADLLLEAFGLLFLLSLHSAQRHIYR